MRWCVIRHPDLGASVVAEQSLVVHRPRGWVRVSEFTSDRDSLHPEQYADAPDLDAEKPDEGPAQTEPAAADRAAAPKTTKATAGKREN